MKLLIDMNLSAAWVDFPRSAGIEAAHRASVGERDALDTDIMAYAAARDYVVLTHDLDFGAILAATNGPGRAWCNFVGNGCPMELRALAWEWEDGNV